MKPFSTIQSALTDFKKGKMLIVVDDESRENEGDLVIAADKATPDSINFMATHGRGLICVAMQKERLDALQLHPMVRDNSARLETAFTVSVDAIKGTTTGISTKDRCVTIQTLLNPRTKPSDLGRPGHIFPLEAKPGGVLQRAGHTEASVDLAKLSKRYPAGVICEIMSPSGEMARLPELREFAQRFGLKIITIQDLIAYRRKHEKLIKRVSEVKLPTKFGDFRLIAFRSGLEPQEHLALVRGTIKKDQSVLVRVHSECLTGDILGSRRCDCGEQRDAALKKIAKAKTGVFLYMRGHEGRGIGLLNKLKAYELQEKGMDTVQANEALGFPADLRHYGIGAQILADLGVRKMKLLTNNPRKLVGLEGHGLKIVERVPLLTKPNPKNIHYLKTKRDKLGHLLGDM